MLRKRFTHHHIVFNLALTNFTRDCVRGSRGLHEILVMDIEDPITFQEAMNRDDSKS
jgi:hypothetical protein